MQVASIVPTPYLGAVAHEDYFMCLYQVVKENEDYCAFFKKQTDAHKFVIMDNGAAEGVNPTPQELVKVYPMVNPSEVVLPDIVQDKEETMRRTEEAYNIYTSAGLHKKMRFMAVPQGETYAEWLECLEFMIRKIHVGTIGISKFVTPTMQEEMGEDANVRLECVVAVKAMAKKYSRPVQIHLLGCWEDATEIGEIALAHPDVRGTDSAFAYVFTRADEVYEAGAKRPDNDEIDFIEGSDVDEMLLSDNIITWGQTCIGK